MDHQDGNRTGLFMALELTPGQLPDQPVWKEREPNSYADFGGNFAMTTRRQITHDRQHTKGDVSDNNPTGGWNEDLTPNNMQELMEGFLYADAHQNPTTRPLNGTAIPITSVNAAADEYRAASGLAIFGPGDLVFASGFFNPANNGLKVVTGADTDSVGVSAALVDDATPAATAMLEVVGFQFAAGGAALSLPAGRAVLTVSAGGLLDLGIEPGEYVGVVGFSATGNNAPFYARVSNVTDTTLEFDKTTGVQAADTGTGKTVQLFFGTVIRNEDDCTLITERTWTLERQYGCGVDAQSDYVTKWTPNQITVTVPTPGADAKVTVDIAGIAGASGERTTTEGVLTGLAGASVVSALNEPCFKPGLDVFQHKLAVIDETTLNPTSLVAYNSEASLVINNNVAGNKAIETFGNAFMNIGEFAVTGSLTAYWTSVEATRRVRQGADLTWHLILTKRNSAVIFDLASLGLGNARATVEANTPVRLPLDTAAGKGKFGYTLLTTFLRYVPDALVAQARI
jgi:hypothetical protein